MNWLLQLHASNPVAYAVLVLSVVSLCGLAAGSLKIRGIGLGAVGVLFAGILAGHFGQPVNHEILDFVREFGLILFVFTIGLQLGPGFFAAWRKQGVKLNLLAGSVVVLGVFFAWLAGWWLGLDPAAIPGLLAGAVTNTPSLGAAQQALATLPDFPADRAALPALAYAVAYPAGIAGIISSLVLLKLIFRIDPRREAEAFQAEQQQGIEPLDRRNLVVENPNLDGVPVGEVPGLRETGVIVSRIRAVNATEVTTATSATVLHTGDTILVVGTHRALDQFQRVIGRKSDEDLRQVSSQVIYRRVVVTNKAVLGKTIKELGLDHLYGVTVTRITRSDLEMTAVPSLHLQFGDVLQVVGGAENIQKAAAVLGNSLKALNETHFIPLFTGIALGILVGMLPVAFPGIPQPVRLGLAGGPLLLAILVGRIGRIGPLVWHMPTNANLAFRELGITLFLACVGLKAGERFFGTVFTPTGVVWLGAGLLITMLPMLIVGAIARGVLKLNFVSLSGLLSGSMTDPPALAFAGSVSGSDAPHVAYATVYPLTMLLRILTAQVLALLLCR